VQCIEHDHAPEAALAEPVNRLVFREHVQFDEERIERAVLSEHLPDPDGADERRQNHRHKQRGGEEFLRWEFAAVGEKRERECEEKGQGGARDREEEGVAQALEIDAVAENFGDEIKSPLSVRIKERASDGRADRPKKEGAEKGGGQQIDDPGEGLRHARAV
jgi:hypothetical protein